MSRKRALASARLSLAYSNSSVQWGSGDKTACSSPPDIEMVSSHNFHTIRPHIVT